MQLTRWNPFVELDDIQQRLNRLFTEKTVKSPADAFADFMPPVDIQETDNEFIVKADLPEMKKEEVKVHLENGVLVIEGERRLNKEEKGNRFHRLEREIRQVRPPLRDADRHRSRQDPRGVQGGRAERVLPRRCRQAEADRRQSALMATAGASAPAVSRLLAWWAPVCVIGRVFRPGVPTAGSPIPAAESARRRGLGSGGGTIPRACSSGTEAVAPGIR